MISCIVGKTEITSFGRDDKTLRKWSDEHKLTCPVCGEELKYYNGEHMIAHFKHLSGSECVGAEYSEKDTDEHNRGKLTLFNWLSSKDNIDNLKVEYWIPETKQRADIYFEYNNKKYVIEFQCTTSTNIKERTDLYNLNDINVIWILGFEKYNNPQDNNRKFNALERDIKNKYNTILYLNNDTLIKLHDFEYIYKDVVSYMQQTYKTQFNFKHKSVLLNNVELEYILNCNNECFDVIDYIDKKINEVNKLIINPLWSKYRVGIYKNNTTKWIIDKVGDYILYKGDIINFDKEEFDKVIYEITDKVNTNNEMYKVELDCDYITQSIKEHINDELICGLYNIETCISEENVKFVLNKNNKTQHTLVKKSINEISNKTGLKKECYKKLINSIDTINNLNDYLNNFNLVIEEFNVVLNEDIYIDYDFDTISFKILYKDLEFYYYFRTNYNDIYTGTIFNEINNRLNNVINIFKYIMSINDKCNYIQIEEYDTDNFLKINIDEAHGYLHIKSICLDDTIKQDITNFINKIVHKKENEELQERILDSLEYVIDKINNNTNFTVMSYEKGYGNAKKIFISTGVVIDMYRNRIMYGDKQHVFKINESTYKIIEYTLCLSVRNIIYKNTEELWNE